MDPVEFSVSNTVLKKRKECQRGFLKGCSSKRRNFKFQNERWMLVASWASFQTLFKAVPNWFQTLLGGLLL
jgi:hypothetical protein